MAHREGMGAGSGGRPGGCGVDYVLVDDRHFVAAGFPRDQLHLPFRTEFGGKSLGVFAIDENLRYYLPFHPPETTADYLRALRASGQRLAVAADDIEKFGGWPGTREWVYQRGWLDDFIRTMKEMEASGEVRIATFGQALAELPSGGPAYLPSSSYREMEEWALPTEGFHRLEKLKQPLGRRSFPGESPLIRGSHWRNFLVKYSESNRMHKKTLALSRLCRERGDPPEARRALGAAQCNDVYWHGVFGGLYLRHLRDTVWNKIAEAEGRLRAGCEDAGFEPADTSGDRGGSRARRRPARQPDRAGGRRGPTGRRRGSASTARRTIRRALVSIRSNCLGNGEVLDIPRLRDDLGTSRKYLIPLLEHVDGLGLTRLRGGERRILTSSDTFAALRDLG